MQQRATSWKQGCLYLDRTAEDIQETNINIVGVVCKWLLYISNSYRATLSTSVVMFLVTWSNIHS